MAALFLAPLAARSRCRGYAAVMTGPFDAARETLDGLWRQGRAAETRGELAAAQHAYQRMVALEARHIPARLRLSRFCQLQDDYGQARQHALHAADALRLGGSWRLAGYVTLRLLDFAEDAEIASVVLSARLEDPDVLAQAHVLAQHLWLAGRFDDALRIVQAALPLAPANALLRYTRGNILRYLGQLESAAADYEASLALAPALSDAHWALATLHRPGPMGRVARLEQALLAHPGPGLDRAQLLFALFHELDAADQRDKAWEALSAGMALMASLQPHAAGSGHAALRAWMDDPRWQPLASEVSGAQAPQPVPVFILGLPRTGTTLLDRMLGNHGWIASAGERNDFAAAMSTVSGRFFPGLAGAGDPGSLLSLDMARVGHDYLQRLRRAAPATALAIDKNPQNLFNLPLILRALPQAKVLVLERAPMDAAFSSLKALFPGGAYGYSYRFEALAAQVDFARAWSLHWASRAPQRVMAVPYEDLARTPEPLLARIQAFLGVPLQEGLSDLSSNPAPVATASSAQVRSAVHTGAIGAWTRYAAPLAPLRALLEPAGA